MDPIKELTEQIEKLEGKAAQLTETLEGGSPEDVKAVKDQLEELGTQIETLEADRQERVAEHETKAMQDQIKSLTERLEKARTPHEGFNFGGGGEPAAEGPYAPDGEFSFYADVKAARSGDTKAFERLEEVIGEAPADQKAMVEGTGSAGGFLVPPEYSAELLALRYQYAVTRQLFTQTNTASNQLIINQHTGGTTVGWVAELATKPQQDLTFAQITTNVFTAAGLAVAANQLLQDAKYGGVDSLINQDLARRLAILEEVAFINGTGTGQPRGILNTSGVNTSAITVTTIPELLDAITDAITQVYTNYFGAPDAILMHPRTWGRIVKAREASAPSTYLIGSGSTVFGRRGNDPLPGYANAQTPRGELFGLPVFTTSNVPTNLGAGTNESRIIVGNFAEGLILDRQGITLDRSEHVYFTSNQTVFRGEERLGFTAARYPQAFTVVQGAGLAGG